MTRQQRQETRDFFRNAGHRIRVARLALGITEQEVADDYEVSLATYRRYEIEAPRRGRFILYFGKRYDVSLDWLMDGEAGDVKPHLAKRAPGKVVILPALGKRGRHIAESGGIAAAIRRLPPKAKARFMQKLEEMEKEPA